MPVRPVAELTGDGPHTLRSGVLEVRGNPTPRAVEAESWYQKLDQDARDKYRQSGRHLMQGLIIYLSTDTDEANAEARSLGYEYANRGRSHGLNISDATQAFLFFRNTLLDALLSVYESASIRSPDILSNLFRKINAFTDGILITLMETYEAFDRSRKK